MIYFEHEIITDSEIWIITVGRDLDLKKDFKLSKDKYTRKWQENTLAKLKLIGCDEGIIWRAINGKYDIDRGGQRLLRRHLTVVGQMYLLDKIWNLIK
jgi:hypothetical protein